MRAATRVLASLFLLAPAAVVAGPFTGTWVAELDSQSGLGQDVYLVSNGIYSCTSCSPPRTYPADGHMHGIHGDPDVISESVTIAGPRTIVTRIVEPAMTRTTTMTVAVDDRTATYVSIDYRQGIKQPLKTVYLARRVAPSPPGAHAASGTWQGVAYQSVPELIRTTELRDDQGRFTYRVPAGVSYTARIGGGFAPVHGPNAEHMNASVERVDPRTLVETRLRDGKTIAVRTFALSADGKTLTISSRYPRTNSTFRIKAHRKSRSF